MLTFRCFGEVTVQDARGLRVSLRSRKHTGLLLYLVAHPRTVHVRDELAYLLWDGHDRKARHSLSQALYDIRSNVGPLLSVDTHSVRLMPNRIVYELDRFEKAFQARDHETVIDLYRGDFAPELANLGADGFERWLDGERERCRVLVTLALRNAQRTAEASGDWDQTCLAALRLVRQNEFDEEAHCALMRGLCMKGDPASALAHYKALRDAGWVGGALKLTELAEWAGGESGSRFLAVHEPAEARLSGRDDQFRRLTEALRDAGPVPVRIALVGERGMGRNLVMHEFARVVQSAGGVVQWLAADRGEAEVDLAEALGRHAGKLRLIVIDADARDWLNVDAALRTEDLSRTLIVGLSRSAAARQAEAARLLDFVLTFDPLDADVCAALVHQGDRLCSLPQAAASAKLSGGNPGLARAITRAWISHEHEHDGIDGEMEGGRFAYERSAEVRSLVGHQLEPLSPGERQLAAVLTVLTPTSRAHAESVVAERSAWDDLDRLKERGWIHSSDGVIRLSRLLAGYVLAWKLVERERAGIHLEAARTLEKGSLSARSAAAGELAAAGEHPRAFDRGCEVALEALRAGRSPVAGQAGRVAFECAASGRDRLRAGLLLAEAELQRGRFRRATAVLHQIAATADRGNDLSRVHLTLARAATASGDPFVRGLQRRRLSEAREHATDGALDRAMAVQLRVLEAMEAGSQQDRASAFEAIRCTLLSIAAGDERYAGIWCDAFRLLFNEVARQQTRSEARLLLERSRYRLGHLGYEAGRTIAAAEFWVAMRGAHLRDALKLLRTLPGPPDENRYGCVQLNNLGAVLLELGDFDAALERLSSCQAMDEELESPEADRAYALLNQAQCAFFKGDFDRCRRYTGQMLLRPDEADRNPFGPQAWALNGLLALLDQNRGEIRASLERLEDGADGAGENDSYLVTWFLSAAMEPERRRHAVRRLMDAADRTAPIDRLSAEKLRVLAGAFSPRNEPEDQREARGLLRSAGASWFVRFANNWSRNQV